MTKKKLTKAQAKLRETLVVAAMQSLIAKRPHEQVQSNSTECRTIRKSLATGAVHYADAILEAMK